MKYVIDGKTLTNIGEAIRTKTTSTDLMTPEQMAEKISEIQTGGGVPDAEKDVKFYDYDGTLLYSYTVEEAAALAELPPLPSRDGLICQEWNWTLEDIKKMGRAVDIGATYITDDGKTRLYIHIEDKAASTIPLCFGQTVANGVTIEWGDGSKETVSGTGTINKTHSYASVGDYVILLDPVDGCTLTFGGDLEIYGVLKGQVSNNVWVYTSMLKKLEIGKNVMIDGYAFKDCYNLSSITIPKGITDIAKYAFFYCSNLSSITIPDGVTDINLVALNSCYNISNIIMPNSVINIGKQAFSSEYYNLTNIIIPDSVKTIGDSSFANCYILKSITIPDGVTSIGQSAFSSNYVIKSITIPDGVTSIGNNAFYSCRNLQSITIPDGVTSIGNNAFYDCRNLPSITIPDGVTSIGNSAFANCNALARITIPKNVTTISSNLCYQNVALLSITIPDGVTTINSYAFYACYSLTNITIPASVTSIGNYAFSGCKNVIAYYIKPTTPPSLTTTGTFLNINSACTIYVPKGSLSAYQSATNWSDYASYMKEYDE